MKSKVSQPVNKRMDDQHRRIGIFGGTFDPVHNGHISIARSFLQSEFIDSLWVLLNPSPPHKPDAETTPYKYRLDMLQSAFKTIADTMVSDIEKELPSPTYTLQTVEYLTDKYPEKTFYLCMGKDSFVSFTSWHKWEQILQYCDLLVADRPKNSIHDLPESLLNKSTFVEHQPINISSTEIRKKLSKGESVNELMPSGVLKIIRKNKLYQ